MFYCSSLTEDSQILVLTLVLPKSNSGTSYTEQCKHQEWLKDLLIGTF